MTYAYKGAAILKIPISWIPYVYNTSLYWTLLSENSIRSIPFKRSGSCSGLMYSIEAVYSIEEEPNLIFMYYFLRTYINSIMS